MLSLIILILLLLLLMVLDGANYVARSCIDALLRLNRMIMRVEFLLVIR